jgi:dihydrofolate reductase
LALVAAMDRNRVIGVDNRLPWHLPADLRRFRELTMGRPVLMGRRTHESIGRPLPGRHNLVLTRDPGYLAPGCTVVRSLEEALAAAGQVPELMVIGGAELYARLLERADRLYLTLVDGELAGDTHFPEYAGGEWVEVARQERVADADNPFALSFVVLERRR